jgi:hypothetical protein
MSLRFHGELGLTAGVLLALLLGVLAAAIYFREVHGRRDRLSRILPFLRGLAVAWLLLLLVGPVLHSEETVPLASRILVFLDASQSMRTTDAQTDPVRKKRIADALGLANADDFNGLSRWRRAEIALTRRGDGLLAQLVDARKNDAEVFILGGAQATRVWSNLPSAVYGNPLAAAPDGATTDLVSPLVETLAHGGEGEPPIAAILLSDGGHNHGPPPSTLVQALARRKVPLFTVALGDTAPPPDLAVLSTDAPESVFIGDRLIGHVTLKDTMPAGLPFRLCIAPPSGPGETPLIAWESRLVTDGSGERRIDFDFPIRSAAQRGIDRETARGVEVMSLPLTLEASVSTTPGEHTADNNRGDLRVRVVKNRRKVLILDGRPRWETRYLHDIFERDKQWEVNLLMLGAPGTAAGETWPRGTTAGTFPQDRETLFTYVLIILGEVPLTALQPRELNAIHDFVGDRAGGLIVIDGPRDHLRRLVGSAVGVMIPVQWTGAPASPPLHLRLTAAGRRDSAMALLPDPAENARLWSTLAAPHWAAGAVALPGSETLLEGVAGERVMPLVVTWRFGAGRVWYHAFEESWRWRDVVADLYHQKYWNQVAATIMEPPFAVRDRYVSLDIGGLMYERGDAARIRALAVDARGRPILKPDAHAVLFRDGRRLATVPLTADEKTGRLSGETAPLEPGSYEVGVEVKGLPESEMKARVGFRVHEGDPSAELATVACNEALLRQLAEASGGQLIREEDLASLPGKIGNLARTRVVEHDSALWQGWPWFVPFVALLAIEWLLRKKLGMI